MIVPGTGIQMNNMLGEYDLNPSGRVLAPGRRMTSMMAPSIVLHGGKPRLVVGSAGSVRLRGAIMQVVVNVVGHGLPVDEAIDLPRVHVDEPHVHCEGGLDPAARGRPRGSRATTSSVGGAGTSSSAGQQRSSDARTDSLAAAGDPRRGGFGVVVA